LLVAAGGLAVNYAVYSLCVVFWPLIGLTVTPGVLPLFVAAGSAWRWSSLSSASAGSRSGLSAASFVALLAGLAAPGIGRAERWS